MFVCDYSFKFNRTVLPQADRDRNVGRMSSRSIQVRPCLRLRLAQAQRSGLRVLRLGVRDASVWSCLPKTGAPSIAEK